MPRRLHLVRTEDETGVSGTGVIVEGIEFSDGTVALRWLTTHTSTAVYASIADVETIHGHGGKTRVQWIDPPRAETCCICGSGDVVYHNYRDQPFCCRCSACGCGPTPRLGVCTGECDTTTPAFTHAADCPVQLAAHRGEATTATADAGLEDRMLVAHAEWERMSTQWDQEDAAEAFGRGTRIRPGLVAFMLAAVRPELDRYSLATRQLGLLQEHAARVAEKTGTLVEVHPDGDRFRVNVTATNGDRYGRKRQPGRDVTRFLIGVEIGLWINNPTPERAAGEAS